MSPYSIHAGRPRPRLRREREPRLRDVVLGTGGFLIAVAAALYLVAALAP